MVYSLGTEKPRQYRAKIISESASTGSFPELFNKEELKDTEPEHTKDGNTAKASNSNLQNKSNESSHTMTNVVIGYSNNDAGGKIVLTQSKCEKNASHVAYTTAQDGKIDYGCWTNDELYIVINWDKNGLNNYTFDRFFDMASGERLKPKHLFEALAATASTNPNGGKK